ncbi:cytochrome b5-related protein [Leptinotarsa decemlineata]|uniref:cytochrome b5-related protein n=1 Tax=Leptinotarsa decemlineata TaxID=7539 RepID=UPI003D30CE08
MPPRSDFVPKSSLGIVPPATRSKSTQLTVDVWLEDKKQTDGAEGLWRVHDGIYDLTDFVKKHPGGSEWLELTKGHDITEAFEAHHISDIPEEMLKKYYKSKAKTKRNAPFTFEKDGFYLTLKREVKEALKKVPKQAYNNTNFFSDALLFFTFLFSILAVRFWSFGVGIIAGACLAMLTVAAHNYLHQKDNFRMYYFQFSLQQVREWRISHVLSHHLHTNTIDDLEISLLEPLLQYLPTKKSSLQRNGSILIAPFLWITYFWIPLIRRLADAPKHEFRNLKITDLSSLILPISMYIFGGQPILATIGMWVFIISVSSCHFAFVGLHAAHHHPDIFHDGDTPRAKENYDWGLSQLDAVMDRKEITGSQFLVLTNFGDHALHHLFPTLDHGALEHLYPVFEEVLKKFGAHLRMVSQWDTVCGGFQQLRREIPNPSPPNLEKHALKK